MKRFAAIIVMSSAALALTACGTTRDQKAATGAVAGALVAGPVGAVVGGVAGAASAKKPN